MPRKQKPSDWKPRNWLNQHDEGESRRLFPPPVMAKLLSLLELEKLESDSSKHAALEQHWEGIILWAISDILVAKNLTKRATPSQRRESLKKIQKKAGELHVLLGNMDFDTSEDLRRAIIADKHPLTRGKTAVPLAIGWGGGVPVALSKEKKKEPPPVSPTLGMADLEELTTEIKRLEKCAKQAALDADYRKEGNKSADLKYWLAKNALKIWVGTGHSPTLITSDKISQKFGPFLAFVSALAEPLGLLPVEDAANRAIDDWRKDKNPMEKNGAK